MERRVDELYGLGGYNPDHPSGNVLDAFEHEDLWDPLPDEPTLPFGASVTVKHYDTDGNVLVDRALSAEEISLFFDPRTPGPADDVMALGSAFVAERLPVREPPQ